MTDTCQDESVPKRSSKPKKKAPRDPNELAAFIVSQATEEEPSEGVEQELTPAELASAAAKALGRLGGLKGGKARAKKLSKRRRAEIAKKAAAKRWSSRKS